MKRLVLLVILSLFCILTLSQETNFLLKKIERDHPGYKTIDYFLIEKKCVNIEYSQDTVLTAYKMAMTVYSIIGSLKESDKKLDGNMLSSLEELVYDIQYEMKFLYGDIINDLIEKIKEYRKNNKIVKKVYVTKKREKIVNNFKTKDLTKANYNLYYDYTSGYETDIFRGIFTDKDYKTYYKGNVKLDFKKFSLKNSLIWNSDWRDFQSSLYYKTKRGVKLYEFDDYKYNDLNTLSYFSYYIYSENKYHFNNVEFDLTNYMDTFKNNLANSYFYSGVKTKFNSIHFSNRELDSFSFDMSIGKKDKEFDINTNFNSSILLYNVTMIKRIKGHMVDGASFTIDLNVDDESNDFDQRLESDTSSYDISFKMPYKNSLYYYKVGKSDRDVAVEDSNFFDAEYMYYSFSRFWFDDFRYDLNIGFKKDYYNAIDKVQDGISVDNNDFTKSWFFINYVNYMDLDSSIDINFFIGDKSFDKNIAGFENYSFVHRSVEIKKGDYIFEYSTLQRSYDTFKGLNSKLFSIGAFYVYNW